MTWSLIVFIDPDCCNHENEIELDSLPVEQPELKFGYRLVALLSAPNYKTAGVIAKPVDYRAIFELAQKSYGLKVSLHSVHYKDPALPKS